MNKSRRFRRKSRRTDVQRSLLPTLSSQPLLRTSFRFRSTGAVSSTIYVRSILNLLHVAVSSTVSWSQIASFQLSSVRMYGVADGGAGSEYNTIALTYAGGLFGKNVEYTSAGSSAVPGSILKPIPKNCACSFWRSVPVTGAISGNGEPLMFLSSLGAGVIIDITLKWILTDGTNPVGVALTVAGATAGLMYTNSLDNSTTSGTVGTNVLQPVARFFLLGYG